MIKVLPMVPSRALDWVTPQVSVDHISYETYSGEAVADLYLPGSRGPHPGVVVSLGVVPLGFEHPQVARLGTALARAGFAALLHWSPAMRDLRLDPRDVDDLIAAYRALSSHPAVNPKRCGFLGTCVGGSFALLAAAHSGIAEQVRFVIAWAPYSSMRTLARDVATSSVQSDTGPRSWEVDQLTRKVYVRSLTEDLEPADVELLRASCAEFGGHVDASMLSDDGRAIYPLLTSLDVPEADAAIEGLPAAFLTRLDSISPIHRVAGIRAPLIVLAHDRDDSVIPIGESRRLVQAFNGHPGVRYTQFMMFKHLDPTKVRLPVYALVRELGKFYQSLYPVFRAGIGSA